MLAVIWGVDTKKKKRGNKSKNKQVRLHQTKELTHSKGDDQESEKTTMKQEKIFVYYEYEKQLLHKTYKAFLQLNSKTSKIWLNSGQRVWIDTFKRRPSSGQHAHEKVLNITNYQGNVNQNHSEIPPHTC